MPYGQLRGHRVPLAVRRPQQMLGTAHQIPSTRQLQVMVPQVEASAGRRILPAAASPITARATAGASAPAVSRGRVPGDPVFLRARHSHIQRRDGRGPSCRRGNRHRSPTADGAPFRGRWTRCQTQNSLSGRIDPFGSRQACPFRRRIPTRAGERVVPARSAGAGQAVRRLRGRTGSRPARSGQRLSSSGPRSRDTV